MSHRMLIVNLGGTSSKVAVYNDNACVWSTSIVHSTEEIKSFKHFLEQYEYRKKAITNEFVNHGELWTNLDAVCSRCGPVKPVEGGTYFINRAIVDDNISGLYGSHPSTLGVMFALELSETLGINAFTVDPPISNEMWAEAAYTGLSEIKRLASFQALNHRATARKYCEKNGVEYADVNLIVAHMGSGITVASHCHGKVVDVNNGLTGDGPFALERAGKLPCGDLVQLCFSGKYTLDEMMRKLNGAGGLIALLGVTEGRVLEKRISEGDEHVDEVIRAMTLNIAKEIASNAAVLSGVVDAIILTGGLAYWERFVNYVSKRIRFIAPISVFPGENELEALAAGALRVLTGKEMAKVYC